MLPVLLERLFRRNNWLGQSNPPESRARQLARRVVALEPGDIQGALLLIDDLPPGVVRASLEEAVDRAQAQSFAESAARSSEA